MIKRGFGLKEYFGKTQELPPAREYFSFWKDLIDKEEAQPKKFKEFMKQSFMKCPEHKDYDSNCVECRNTLCKKHKILFCFKCESQILKECE